MRTRDARADEQFFYAVKTTGVFCCPSCGSRRPRRENVLFFDSSSSAERAGFRACRRCKPDQPAPNGELLQNILMACRWLEGAEREPSLAQLANAARLSPSHFQRLFKSLVGHSPKQYATRCRVDRFRNHVQNGASVTSAIYAAGFSSPSRAYDAAASEQSISQSTLRNGAKTMTLDYTVTNTELGWILIAADESAVVFLAFGDDPVQSQADLRLAHPRALLRENCKRMAPYAKATLAYLQNPRAGLHLPLNPPGSDFRRQVWSAIAKIPPGQTTSYTDLAAALGRPSVTRAVAAACAANPIALAIPCHRVVGKRGELRGYRWGIDRKKKLLAGEQ